MNLTAHSILICASSIAFTACLDTSGPAPASPVLEDTYRRADQSLAFAAELHDGVLAPETLRVTHRAAGTTRSFAVGDALPADRKAVDAFFAPIDRGLLAGVATEVDARAATAADPGHDAFYELQSRIVADAGDQQGVDPLCWFWTDAGYADTCRCFLWDSTGCKVRMTWRIHFEVCFPNGITRTSSEGWVFQGCS